MHLFSRTAKVTPKNQKLSQRRLRLELLEKRRLLASDMFSHTRGEAPVWAESETACISVSSVFSNFQDRFRDQHHSGSDTESNLSTIESTEPIQQLWVAPADANKTVGRWSTTSNGEANFVFGVPSNMTSFSGATIIAIASKTASTEFEVSISVAKNGEDSDAFEYALTGQGPVNLVKDELVEIDVSNVFPGTLESGVDNVALQFKADNKSKLTIVGLRFLYEGPVGAPGPMGETGPQGPAGADGAVGPQGPQGVAGPVGPAGVDGADGVQGPAGPQGPAGADGAQGPAGADGVDGAVGPQGPTGAAGLDGAVGPQGPAGVDGIAGATGPQGPAGVNGAVGPQGPQGVAGLQGLAGVDGVDGAVGPQGPAGADGIDGDTGAQGPAGADGAVGPQGPQGVAGPQGPAGVDGNDGSVGPQGPAGADGAQGPAGVDGADGAQGPAGPQGPAGADGADGAVGPQGVAGLQGPQGDTGPAGPVGTAGADGVDGVAGPQGPAGPQGNAGVDGAVGPQGPAGADGIDGAVGPQGPQGETGPQGPEGAVNPNADLLDGIDSSEFALAVDLDGGLNAVDARLTELESNVESRVQRDLLVWNTTNSLGTLHIKTNIAAQTNVMYRISVDGYNYALSQPIANIAVGYTYTASSGITNSSNTNLTSGASISQYVSSDGYVVLKLTSSNFYYTGFSVSASFVNPAGGNSQMSAQVFQQVANL